MGDIWSVPEGLLAEHVCEQATPLGSLGVSCSDVRAFIWEPQLTVTGSVPLPVTFRHGLWDQEGGWHYPCRGEEDVVPAMSPSTLHMRLWGVHVWGSGSYSGTPVMTKLQFVSGWFEKHYAFLKRGDRRQKRLCLGSNALYQGSETGWACDCWVLNLVSPSDRFWFPPRPSGLSLGSEEVLRLGLPVQCPFPWFPTSRLRFLGLTA